MNAEKKMRKATAAAAVIVVLACAAAGVLAQDKAAIIASDRSKDGYEIVAEGRRRFEITGLDRVFTIYPTREDAVSKLGTTGNHPPA